MNNQERAAMYGLVAALETEISLYYAPEDRPQMLIDAISAGREALERPQVCKHGCEDSACKECYMEHTQPQGEWAIDTSTNADILVYKNCSVIEGDQAHYILNLIKEQPQCEPVGCMVKGRLLSYKDNGIPNDCLLYLAPPSAAQAARQMRDAAAMEAYKVCAETRHVKLGDAVFKAIAALPIIGEKK